MKANPKAYFPNTFLGVIGYRKVDKWAEYQKVNRPYFETWEEARAYLLDYNQKQLAMALANSTRYQKKLAKVMAMKRPAATDFVSAAVGGKGK